MLTVSQVARKAKVADNTVRNYVRDYPDLFSEAARGLQGNRLFADNDVEVFCSLVALKDSGMPLAEAAEYLRSRAAPPVIDVAAMPLQTPAKASNGVEAFLLAHNDLQRQIDALRVSQREQLWRYGVVFYLGMATMGILFWLTWLLNNWWYR